VGAPALNPLADFSSLRTSPLFRPRVNDLGFFFERIPRVDPIDGPIAAPGPNAADPVSRSATLDVGALGAHVCDGEVCKGSAAPVAQDDPTARSMVGWWDRVYGAGSSQTDLPGLPRVARSTLTGSTG